MVTSVLSLLDSNKTHNFHFKSKVLYEAHMLLASTNISEKSVANESYKDANQQACLMNSIVDISSEISQEYNLAFGDKLTTPPCTPVFK